MAVKDSIGGWKDNAILVNLPKACSTIKQFMGNTWVNLMQSLGYSSAVCPIPAVRKIKIFLLA